MENEWIFGQPVATQTVYEWVLGQPHVVIEKEEVPPEGIVILRRRIEGD